MKPTISIIVPIYNVEKYLKRCIESILNQTFKDYEVILVDDGSTDNCPRICDEFKSIDKRVTVIHKANGGLSDARNTGLDISKGKYIAFIDSDDYIDEKMYEHLYDLIVTNDADIAECNLIRTDGNIEITQPYKRIQIRENDQILEGIYKISACKSSICVCNKLFKKDLFTTIRFPKGKIHEDLFVTPKLFFYSNKIVVTNQIYYYYFENYKSITRSEFSLKKLDILEGLKITREFYKSNYLSELVQMTDQIYSTELLINYNKMKSIKHYDNYKKLVFREYKENLMCFLKSKYITPKYKLFLILCRFYPNLYSIVYNKYF